MLFYAISKSMIRFIVCSDEMVHEARQRHKGQEIRDT